MRTVLTIISDKAYKPIADISELDTSILEILKNLVTGQSIVTFKETDYLYINHRIDLDTGVFNIVVSKLAKSEETCKTKTP